MAFNKYRAKRRLYQGYSFASGGEAECFAMLKLMERAGEIEVLQVQCQVELSDAKIVYKPDFKIKDLKTGETVYVEFKGFQTAEWRIKRKLWLAYGPSKLLVYGKLGSRITLIEELIPKRSE